MKSFPKTVAILGGAFDPVHLGHLSLAEDAYREFAFDEVWFLPSAQSPLKGYNPSLDRAGRVELLEAALQPYPPFQLNRSELDRGGISYSIDTMRRFNTDYPETAFSWIVGGDQFVQLDQWRDIEELVSRVRFLVISRPGYEIDHSDSPQIAGLRTEKVASRHLDISSSDIRERLARGKPVNHLLPKAVAELIVQRNYYRV